MTPREKLISKMYEGLLYQKTKGKAVNSSRHKWKDAINPQQKELWEVAIKEKKKNK